MSLFYQTITLQCVIDVRLCAVQPLGRYWEDDDYNRYLSDLFWDDMLDTAPWMREA